MLHDVTEVKVTGNHRLWLRFNDGANGEVDLKKMIRFDGVFTPLADQTQFAKVYVHPELGVICWPNGIDLDTEVLYAAVTGHPIAWAQS